MALYGSVQSSHLPITQLPLASLSRPIPPQIDARKVDSMVQTLHGQTCSYVPTPAPERIEAGKLPPVDVLHYRRRQQQTTSTATSTATATAGTEETEGQTTRDFYFAFGGCHRLRAYEEAGREMVDCRVMEVTKAMLKVYLGASVDAVVGE